jgi:hypothetical protein
MEWNTVRFCTRFGAMYNLVLFHVREEHASSYLRLFCEVRIKFVLVVLCITAQINTRFSGCNLGQTFSKNGARPLWRGVVCLRWGGAS